jgi:hypothetical protein
MWSYKYNYQITRFLKTFNFFPFICSQTWLNPFMDDCQCRYYITKVDFFSFLWFFFVRGFVEVAIWERFKMKITCSLSIQIYKKSGNAFVQPCPSLTLAFLLSPCKLQTRSPWPSLWHVASTRWQFVLHDLPFV